MDIKKLFSLEGKVALVTGGAYGIGYSIAKGLALAGAKIAFNCRGKEHMEEALANYKKDGIEVKGYFADVTKEEEVKELIAKIEKDLGVIDILVNNAGIIKRIPMCDMQVSEFKEVIDIDLVAPFIVAKHCIPQMIKKGHGKIINICSEFGGHNIQCNGLGPGYIATPQTAPLREKQKNGSQHPFDKFIISKTPARKWGDPDELIGSAIFLASDASNFVNGQILYVDGGILAYIGKNPE